MTPRQAESGGRESVCGGEEAHKQPAGSSRSLIVKSLNCYEARPYEKSTRLTTLPTSRLLLQLQVSPAAAGRGRGREKERARRTKVKQKLYKMQTVSERVVYLRAHNDSFAKRAGQL